MQVSSSELPDSLLRICVALPWITPALLKLLEDDQTAIEALLASAWLAPAAEWDGALRLREELRAELLVRLSAGAPYDEQARLQITTLNRLLQRLAALPGPNPALLEVCFAQLLAGLQLLNLRREWAQMQPLLDLAAAIGFSQTVQQQRLTYYTGLVAVRAQHYSEGEAQLHPLACDEQVLSELRMLAWNALGASYYGQAQYDRALLSFQHVQTLAQAIGEREHEGLALLNLSIVQNELGAYEQALSLAQASLGHFQALGQRHREAHALYEIGNTALQLGYWREAQAQIDLALACYQELGTRHGLGAIYWVQGLLHHALNEIVASEQAYQQCLQIAASPELYDPVMLMDARSSLGLLYQSEGRFAEARATYQEALAFAIQVENDHARLLISYRLGTLYEQLGQLADAATAYAEAITMLEGLRHSLDTLEAKLGLLGTTAQIYEAMVRLCLLQGQAEQAFDYVERARSRAFLDLRLQQPMLDGAYLPTAPLSCVEVQARLTPGTVLIAYFTTGVLSRADRLVNRLAQANARLRALLSVPSQIYLFALTRTTLEVVQVRLDPNSLRPAQSVLSASSRLLSPNLLRHLSTNLIAPVAHLLNGCRAIYLVPHGPLHHVPFGALSTPDGRNLVDPHQPPLVLAPSATILLEPGPERRSEAPTASLALGYNDSSQQLRFAEAEARLVAWLTGGTSLIGPAPKADVLREAAPRLRWLHIAGHTEVHVSEPLASGLVISATEQLTGYWVMEALQLSAEQVSLSACTSGLSHVLPGDEQLGLPRAFLHAGAASVLCTLWEAADRVALLMMERFYRALLQGLSAPVALRDAQVAVREMSAEEVVATFRRLGAAFPDLAWHAADEPGDLAQRPFADPFYWAPFVLVGRAAATGA